VRPAIVLPKGLEYSSARYQMWFHRIAMPSLPSPMDSGARAFGQSAEAVLDQRQTRHPNSYNSENDGNWVGR